MWSDLNAKHLLAFRAVVEEGTFGRAAERLGFTQSAISQQVASLEALVGQSLFDRPSGPHPPTLTHAGDRLLPHAMGVLERITAAEHDLDRLARGVTGTLSIGTFQSISARVLPAALRGLYAEAPGLEVSLEAEEQQELRLDAIHDGSVDLSFLIAESRDGFNDYDQLDYMYLGADPHVAIMPASHPPGPVLVSDISGTPLVGQPPSDACGIIIDRALERFGVTANYAFRSHDNAAVQGMVGAGVGPAIMPLLTIDTSDPTISVRALEPPIPPRHHAIVWNDRRSLSPLAKRFVELTVVVCDELLAVGNDVPTAT